MQKVKLHHIFFNYPKMKLWNTFE